MPYGRRYSTKRKRYSRKARFTKKKRKSTRAGSINRNTISKTIFQQRAGRYISKRWSQNRLASANTQIFVTHPWAATNTQHDQNYLPQGVLATQEGLIGGSNFDVGYFGGHQASQTDHRNEQQFTFPLMPVCARGFEKESNTYRQFRCVGGVIKIKPLWSKTSPVTPTGDAPYTVGAVGPRIYIYDQAQWLYQRPDGDQDRLPLTENQFVELGVRPIPLIGGKTITIKLRAKALSMMNDFSNPKLDGTHDSQRTFHEMTPAPWQTTYSPASSNILPNIMMSMWGRMSVLICNIPMQPAHIFGNTMAANFTSGTQQLAPSVCKVQCTGKVFMQYRGKKHYTRNSSTVVHN